MILAGSRLLEVPVMGLQTGGELAKTQKAIIDPARLEILAYQLHGPLLGDDATLLRIADVREFSDIGIIVDSSDEFVSPDDIIKLGEIYKLNFHLDGMQVMDEEKTKLGKIVGYTIDTNGFLVQQISVKRPLLKRLNDTELLIHRSQIIEINDNGIVVHSQAEIPEPRLEAVRASYVNPFRKNSTATPERIDNSEK